MNLNTIFFIDPQSYGNLGCYDYSLLSNIEKNYSLYFFCSTLYSNNEIENVSINRIYKYNKAYFTIFKIFSYLLSQILLLTYCIIKRPNIIHIQWCKLIYLDNIIYYLIKRFLKIKIIYTAHNVLPHNTGLKYKKIYRMWYRNVDAIIVHSLNTKEELVEKFNLKPQSIHVIFHGILNSNIDEEEIERRMSDIKNSLNLSDKFIFSHLGSLSEYKGTDILIDSWITYPKLHSNTSLYLLIIGKNTNIDLSKTCDFKNIYVLDKFVSELDFIAFTRLSNILVLPYRQISQSGVLFTAINEKTPFIVTNKGGLPDPLKIAPVGYIINSESPDELANILINISNNREQVKNIKKNSQLWDKVILYYSWEQIGKLTSSLYNNFLYK